MQVICTSLQTDNHASTSSLKFLQAGCPSCCPTISVKALKVKHLMSTYIDDWFYVGQTDALETGYRTFRITMIYLGSSLVNRRMQNYFSVKCKYCHKIKVRHLQHLLLVSWSSCFKLFGTLFIVCRIVIPLSENVCLRTCILNNMGRCSVKHCIMCC